MGANIRTCRCDGAAFGAAEGEERNVANGLATPPRGGAGFRPGTGPDASDKADRNTWVTQRRRSGDTEMSRRRVSPEVMRHAGTAETAGRARPGRQSRMTCTIISNEWSHSSVDGPGSGAPHVGFPRQARRLLAENLRRPAFLRFLKCIWKAGGRPGGEETGQVKDTSPRPRRTSSREVSEWPRSLGSAAAAANRSSSHRHATLPRRQRNKTNVSVK